MTTENDAQASAMAAALLPALTDALKKDVLPGLIEESIGGLKKNTDRMLDQLKASNSENTDLKAQMEAAAADIAARGSNTPAEPDPNAPMQISKEDARDVRLYRKAKEQAAEKGVALQIVAD